MPKPRETALADSPAHQPAHQQAHQQAMPTPLAPIEVLPLGTRLPSIAIISPSYNQAPFVRLMLESVAKQNYQPAEHIINDALSTDGAADILRDYADRTPIAKLRIQRDKGQIDAINQGLAAATADVLTWLNTDDFYTDPGALQTVAEIFAAEPETDVVYARGRFVNAEGKFLRDAYINRDPDALERELTHSLGILQPAAFFRRSVLERFGPLDEKYNLSFDYEYWIRLARMGARFRFLDRPIVDAVLHDASKTGGQRARQYDEILRAVHQHYGFVTLRWLRRAAECAVCGADGMINNASQASPADLKRIDDLVAQLQATWNATPAAHRRLLARPDIGPGSTPIAETLGDLHARALVKTDRTVVTSFTSAYFQQGLNLIASLHRLGPQACSLILVYDIDLTPEQRERLSGLDRVAVRSYPPETAAFFEGYMAPKNYAYKCAAIHAAGLLVQPGDRVLWIDAGVVAVRAIDEIFDIIARTGAFFVDHDDKPGWPFHNATFTHPEAARRLGATGRELLAPHLCSCLLGFAKDGPAQPLIDQAYALSQDPKIVAWPKHLDKDKARPLTALTPDQRAAYATLVERAAAGKEVPAQRVLDITPYLGHRQDQTIYSILCARFGFTPSSARKFCWSDDASSRASLANWQSGAEANLQRSHLLPPNIPPSTLTYHHRGLYDQLDGLAPAETSHTLVLLGNGPSLRDFDFHALKGADTIGMNAAYRHWDRIHWYPTYYCCMDTVVILSHAEAILRLIRQRQTNGIRRFFLREVLAEAHPWIRSDPSVVLLEDARDSYKALAVKAITTGNFSALFGAAMGYKRIALLGIDCNYVEQITEAKPAGETRLLIEKTPDRNPNYFFDDYQQSGDLFNIPNVHPGFHARSWAEAERTLTELGVEVLSCNPQSKLSLFPAATLEEALTPPAQRPPKPLPAEPIGAAFARDAKARIEELDFLRLAIGPASPGDLMVDVGAHQGGSSAPFLKAGWDVLAFEPDPGNREQLQKRLGSEPNFSLDPRALGSAPKKGVPFFASDQSSGASSLAAFTESHHQAARVDVTTLAIALKEHRAQGVRLLKIDAEGFDKHVLEGFPWDSARPAAIMCEFEDRKTIPLGYTAADMARLLKDKGYTVFVSQWHPIVRYGIQHDWHRLFPFDSALSPATESWGNLLAFRFPADAEAFAEIVRAAIVEGHLTSRKPATPHHQPPAPKTPLAPQPAPAPRPILRPKPLPKRPFVRIKLPWAPRRPELHTRQERLRLMLGKLARIYWGRAGILAAATLALWAAALILIATAQPLWLALTLMTAAWVPLLTMIALLAVTARRQAFENDAALRAATERAIREAIEFTRLP